MRDRETGVRKLSIMRWGLVPFWADDIKSGSLSTFNARAEVLETRPMWRDVFKKRRCLLPADAYYEWKKLDDKTKQLYAFGMQEDAMFAIAGIWEHWMQPDGN